VATFSGCDEAMRTASEKGGHDVVSGLEMPITAQVHAVL